MDALDRVEHLARMARFAEAPQVTTLSRVWGRIHARHEVAVMPLWYVTAASTAAAAPICILAYNAWLVILSWSAYSDPVSRLLFGF